MSFLPFRYGSEYFKMLKRDGKNLEQILILHFPPLSKSVRISIKTA